MCLLLLLLSNDLSCVECDQHTAVSLELFNRDGKTEVVEKQELKFQMIQLHQGEASDLCVSGIRVEYIGEELARTSHASDDQSMNVETVNDEEM